MTRPDTQPFLSSQVQLIWIGLDQIGLMDWINQIPDPDSLDRPRFPVDWINQILINLILTDPVSSQFWWSLCWSFVFKSRSIWSDCLMDVDWIGVDWIQIGSQTQVFDPDPSIDPDRSVVRCCSVGFRLIGLVGCRPYWPVGVDWSVGCRWSDETDVDRPDRSVVVRSIRLIDVGSDWSLIVDPLIVDCNDGWCGSGLSDPDWIQINRIPDWLVGPSWLFVVMDVDPDPSDQIVDRIQIQIRSQSLQFRWFVTGSINGLIG